MKKGPYLLAVLGLAAMWVGCKKTEPTTPSPAKKETAQVSTPAAADATSTAFTLVKLKVPNMT